MKKCIIGKGWAVIIFFSALLLAAGPAFSKPISVYPSCQAQQQQVNGSVADASGPLPGVTILIKGTTVNAVSDLQGKFSIAAIPGDVLVFQFIGYQTLELTVAGNDLGTVLLTESATSLEEVTINAGYYSVKQKESTGSISRITAKEIETQPVTNVLATMQGRMAGVSITQSSGVAGSGFDIKIRGQNSLRPEGNAPLYIIDGIPYSSDPIGTANTNTVMPTPVSPLTNINPGDIESLEVLKDADATAIYGSRGANGVVLITTKRGKAGKTKVTAKASRGFGEVTRFANLMGTAQYLAMRAEGFANDGITEYPSYAYDINGTWDPNRYTDWQKELIGRTADIIRAEAALSGGTQQTQFMVGSNYSRETTVFPGNFAYQKGNVRVSLSHESLNGKFHTTFTAGYTHQDNDQPSRDYTVEARMLAPNAPSLYDGQGNLNWEDGTFNNPLRNLEGKSLSKTYDLVSSLGLSYRLAEGLELKSSFGFTDLRHKESSSQPSTIYNPSYGIGPEYSSIVAGSTTRQSWIIEPQVNYTKSWGEAKLDVLAGGTFQSQASGQLIQRASGFTSNSLINNLAAAAVVTTDLDETAQYRYQAVFARANINWKGRYIANITGRRDGSSRFGPGRQFANFGAVGAAWLFSREDLFQDSFLSFGKLRASYGVTGNDQIGNYQFLDTYGTSGTQYQGIVGLGPLRLYNPDFGWETNRKLEAGLELSFLADRINFTASWFRNRSSNQLAGIPLPGTTGFASIQANLDATIENRGLEFTLQSVNFQKQDVGWTTSLNLTLARNELLAFPGLATSTYSNQFVIGEPLNIRKVYHLQGVDTQTGMYEFKDYNGDGVITADKDRGAIAEFNPKYFGGLQNSLRYKNWHLDFLFQFVSQKNLNTSALGVPGTMGNQSADLANHWQQAGDIAHYQLFTSGSNAQASQAYANYYNSDGAIVDASYIRLKNICLSYQLPSYWLKGLGCTVFFEGQNLLTFTRFKGADPEFISSSSLPPLRVFTTGLQVSF